MQKELKEVLKRVLKEVVVQKELKEVLKRVLKEYIYIVC